MTPHNEAKQGDYAETVLVAGDLLRVKWIAETFLDDARRVNGVRGALGYSGTYRGVPVSLQATGMGRPSFTIYVHELVAFFGVRTIIRIGSCGGLTEATPLREIVVAESALMDTDLDAGGEPGRPDRELLERALQTARSSAVACHSGPMICSDVFYHPQPQTRFDEPRRRGFIAVDMETANLFWLAGKLDFRALSMCTIVDSLLTGEETALSERPQLFASLARLALDVAAGAR